MAIIEHYGGVTILSTLLDKIKNLNTVFRESSTMEIPVDDLCKRLSSVLSANIYLFEPDGRIFSYATSDKFFCEYNEDSLKANFLPREYQNMFKQGNDTRFNMYEEIPTCTCEGVKECIFNNRYYCMMPVFYNYQKKAGILLIRYGDAFSNDEEVLCEYTSAIVSLDLMRAEQERIRQQSLQMARAQLAADALSFSELVAANAALSTLPQDSQEGIVMLNTVSSQIYVTHSTVSGALKKLETAGVIKTKSMGVKGKLIRVTNPYLVEEIARVVAESD